MNYYTSNNQFKKEYIDKIFQEEIEIVSSAQPGNRNNQLNVSAFKLGTLVGAGALSKDVVEEALLQSCEQNGLVKEGRDGIMNTIKSGIDAGLQKPRNDLPQNIQGGPVITTYPYVSAEGELLFEVIRVPPKTPGEKKKFYQRRYDIEGTEVYGISEGWYEKKETNNKFCWRKINQALDKNLQPHIAAKWFDHASLVPYHLSKLIENITNHKLIYYCEGEKDTDRLIKLGLAATTNPMGAAKEMPESFYQFFGGADIAILEDNNEAGRRQTELLLRKLKPLANTVTLIRLPGLKEGEDVSDWLNIGNSLGELEKFVEKERISQSKTKRKLVAINIKDFLLRELPPRELLLDPILPKQGLVMIHAMRGVGKTFIALGIAYAIAGGSKFLKWKASKSSRVLYLDGEMPAVVMQERLARIVKVDPIDLFDSENLKIITPDLQDGSLPDLSSLEGQESLMEYIDDFDLLVVDNLSTLCRSGKENEGESWLPIQELSLSLRKRGKSVLFVHHSGKTGLQRGTSRKEDILDTVIMLKHAKDYSPDQGARFEIHFEKNRGFCGDASMPFEASMSQDGIWAVKDLEDKIDDQIIELTKEGMSCEEIGEIIGRNKSTVSRRQKKLREQGKL